jgi:hypothetical protein
MFVHSCCCIWIFVLSGLIQIQKRIQNNLKMLWNIWKGKRKKSFISHPSFRPVKPSSLPHTRSLPASRVRGPSPAPLFPRLGPSPADGPVHARCRLSSLRVTNTTGPLVMAFFFFSMPRPISFLVSTDRILSSQSFPSLIGSSLGYISRARTPFCLHPTLSRCQQSSRDATASLELYHATTVRHPELYAVPGPSSAPFSREVSSSCSVLPPRVFLSLNHAWNRAFAFSGDGAAAGLTVGPLFRPSAATGCFRSDPIHPFCIQRLRLADTGSAGDFA